MHDEHPRGILDDDLVHPRQDGVLLGEIKLQLGRFDEPIHFRVDIGHHVGGFRRHHAAMKAARETAEGVNEPVGDIHCTQRSVLRVVEPLPPAQQEGIPFDGDQLQVDPYGAQILLDELVHGEGQHLPGARGRDERTGLDPLALVSRLFEQRFRPFRIVLIADRGVPKPGMPRVHLGDGGGTRAIEELAADPLPIDGIIGRLPDQFVIPGRLGHVERIGPDMRVGPQDDLKAGLLQTGNAIRRWYFNPVHLAGAQRREPCGGFRHGE